VWLYIASAVLFLLYLPVGLHHFRHFMWGGPMLIHGSYGFVWSIRWFVRLVARFIFRSELLQHFNTVEPIGLQLSGVMTFFFGGLYFQYHFNRINEIKRSLRGGAFVPA
jgi:hypothetical protein